MGSRAALIGVLLAAVSGCASIPSAGDPQAAHDVAAGEPADPGVRVFPRVPDDGATPEEIVVGFLDASGAVALDTARAYLTMAAADDWNPADVVVYSTRSNPVPPVLDADEETPAGEQRVLTAQVVAGLTGGAYQAQPGDGEARPLTFPLVEEDGQWRIADPPDQLLVSRTAFEREYASYNLYFINETLELLVPDPVYLPANNSEELPNVVVDTLLRGPTAHLQPAVTTAFPEGTRRAGPILIEAGIAHVGLSEEARGASAQQLDRFTAQLAWSLGPDIEDVEVTIVDGVAQPLAARLNTSLQPARPPEQTSQGQPARPAYFLNNGQLYTLPEDDATSRPVGAFPGVTLAEFAVQPQAQPGGRGNDRIAGIAVTETESELYLQLPTADAGANPIATGTNMRSPSWDRKRLWLVEDSTPTISLVKVVELGSSGTGQLRDVTVEGLGGRTITRLAVSEDGARAALVLVDADGFRSAVLGVIAETDDGIAIVGLRPVAPSLDGEVLDVAWRDPSDLVLLLKPEQVSPQPYVVQVDGSSPEALGAVEATATTVAAAPGGRPILVGTTAEQTEGETDEQAADQILRQTEGPTFTPVADGRYPRYAG